jgi:hypothetical protein
MGKKRITQLLDQLQANQQQDLQNAAAIFTVAQVAVNQLQEMQANSAANALPAASEAKLAATAASSLSVAAPVEWSEAELRQRYGSHTACRQAAKKQGIVFSKTPTWQQLGAAFAYFDICQELVQSYMQIYPNSDLKGISFQIRL